MSSETADMAAKMGARPFAPPVWVMWFVTNVLAVAGAAIAAAITATPGASAASGTDDVYTISFLILAPVYASVGAVIVSRGSGNRVGWIICIVGLLLAMEDFAGAYATFAGTAAGKWLPAGIWLSWVSSWIWVPAIVTALGLLPMYFPDGRAPSPRWRPLLGGIWVVLGLVLVGTMFSPGVVTASALGPGNPVGLAFLVPLTDVIHALYVLVVLAGAFAGAASLVIRYRRGSADERHQVKWFAGAFALVAITLAVYGTIPTILRIKPAGWLIGAILSLGLTVIPVAVAIAVLKYRLYDIDVVINRGLVYGSLAVFISAVYVSIVVGVGALVDRGGQPNLALSVVATAIAAVAFQGVRQRVQRVANQLVYGRRATPYEILSKFSERVAESYALDEVLPRMARVLADGTGAERADVWIRAGTTLRRAASWPEAGPPLAPSLTLVIQGQLLPDIPEIDRATAVRHQGELLGALTVTKRSGESLTPVEESLLDDLGHQAGLVLKNVGLTAELLQRLEDLRASRQRLVAAQDEERRRLERNLHDGAQQNLVALKVKVGLMKLLSDKNPEKVRRILDELGNDADQALETLRDLARGIYPPLLADQGLQAALEMQARRATIPVQILADGLARYSRDDEAAVYFCCLEALQNVQKYAEASHATVRLFAPDGELAFEVEDDGRGFDPATTKKGSGLQNIEDRLQAMGGNITLATTPAGGTKVGGHLPSFALKTR